MASFNDKLKSFAVDLFTINAIKFGEFKTKVGLMTPVYCDLRVIVSHPKVMDTLSTLLVEYIKNLESFDLICGVPYTALPIATTVSVKTDVPMVMRRKEAKDYGTRKLIEGTYSEGNSCLIIEDVVTSGSSILETVKDLNDAGIKCRDAVVLLNREQGGANILKERGITMHALLSMTQLMLYLKEANCIDDSIVNKISNYLQNSQVDASILKKNISINRLKLSYDERVKFSKNSVTKKLLKIISDKKTNLCLAADVTKSADLINLAKQTGPYICLLKTHIDIIEDFSLELIKTLESIAKSQNFILFEDRKFADIGKTVELQYSKGIYQISSWAELVTAHSLTGKGVLDAIKQSSGLDERGVFLLAETSAAGSLINDNYTKGTLKLASEYPDLIAGVVCQNPLFTDNPGMIQLTPGVQLGTSGDNLGQQYNSPANVVLERGADVAVVGRGITQASEPGVVAEKYKKLLWDAYLKRVE